MKPILFNTEMVRAIQNGTKTVTRRVMKPRFCDSVFEMFQGQLCEASPYKPPIENSDGSTTRFVRHYVPCRQPYRPGDILYVRERFRLIDFSYCDDDWNASVQYADESLGPRLHYLKNGSDERIGWRPSIHMPREAARIFLRVTDVRVERLRDITGAQAKREGFTNRGTFIREFLAMYPDCTPETWLWVTEFERISKEEE